MVSKVDAAGNDLSTDKVFMVKEGFLASWVCAPKHMNKEAVQEAVKEQVRQPGTSGGWQVQEQHDEHVPQACSPGLCSEDETRQHWLVHC